METSRVTNKNFMKCCKKNLISLKAGLLNVQSPKQLGKRKHIDSKPQNRTAIKGSNLAEVGGGCF